MNLECLLRQSCQVGVEEEFATASYYLPRLVSAFLPAISLVSSWKTNVTDLQGPRDFDTNISEKPGGRALPKWKLSKDTVFLPISDEVAIIPIIHADGGKSPLCCAGAAVTVMEPRTPTDPSGRRNL